MSFGQLSGVPRPLKDKRIGYPIAGVMTLLFMKSCASLCYRLMQVCQSQIHRGPKKQIGYNPRAGLVQCLLKHIEMIARSLLNQDLTQCII